VIPAARAFAACLLTSAVAAGSAVIAQAPPPTTPPPTTTQAPPKPQPFPGSGGQTSPPARPATPPSGVATPAPAGTPTEQDLGGAPVYPGAEYLDSFDAGQGQRYFLFGTNTPYEDIVTYYRNVMRGASNREIFRAPAMHQFDLGRYQEDSMAYPPSVVVKDYTWNDSPGYLVVEGAAEKRFKTIIQIVPR
jgi:hypothetical protein